MCLFLKVTTACLWQEPSSHTKLPLNTNTVPSPLPYFIISTTFLEFSRSSDHRHCVESLIRQTGFEIYKFSKELSTYNTNNTKPRNQNKWSIVKKAVTLTINLRSSPNPMVRFIHLRSWECLMVPNSMYDRLRLVVGERLRWLRRDAGHGAIFNQPIEGAISRAKSEGYLRLWLTQVHDT